MHTIEALEQIRDSCMTNISYRLAVEEGVRQSFLDQLDRFYESLSISLETSDPARLDSILSEWVYAYTQTEIDSQEMNVIKIVSTILSTTGEVSSETLSQEDALHLIGDLIPFFTYIYETASQMEIQLHLKHMSANLEDTTLSLERLEKSKSEFIAVAAHELKTPLTLIEGYTAMIKEVAKDHRLEQNGIDLYLQGIDGGNKRLRQIIDDMIDVSIIDNNLLSINYQPVWINRLLEAVRYEMDQLAMDRNQAFEINKFPGCDEMTYGDGERLLQAFRNVIANGIKYTPDGGKILVDGRLLPGFIEITVSDTGIGIDPEYHILIFEKFGRLGNIALHSSSKTKFKGGGPGLGLPITKGIIEAHGGAIWVESEGYDEVKCPGSTFHILLPVRKEPPEDKTRRLLRVS